MNVHWTDTAEEHLDAIYRHIARNSEVYAKRVVDVITRRSIQIGTFPLSGKEVPEYEMDGARNVMREDKP